MRTLILTLSLFPSLIMAASFRKSPSLYLTGQSNEMKVVCQLDTAPTGSVTLIWSWLPAPTSNLPRPSAIEVGVMTRMTDDHVYERVVTGLLASESYQYALLVDGHLAKGRFRAPPTDDATTLSFYALGDCRSYPDVLANVLSAVQADMADHPERQSFCLHSGDWTENGQDEEAWDREWFRHNARQESLRARLPFTGTQGNHDAGPVYRKYIRMPFLSSDASYHAIDYGPVRIINIDQCAWLRAGDKQYNWITNELAVHTNKHIIFCFHAPGWSTGHQANDRGVQNFLQPLFEHYGVPLVFCGHNHNYTHAMTGGVHHVTTGGAGAPLFAGKSNAPCVIATEAVNHFIRIDINGPTGTVTAFRTNMSVIESFSYVKPTVIYPLEPLKVMGDEPTPSITVPYAAKMKARGKPTRIKWATLPALPIYRDTWGFPLPEREATFQIVHDGAFLYIRLLEEGDHSKLVNKDYAGDHWELFIAPTRGEPYRQIAIMPGTKLDFHAMGEADDVNQWRKAVGVKTVRQNRDCWDIQIAIPLEKLSQQTVKSGDTLYMNIFRAAAGNNASTAWSPVFSDSFHNIIRFGEVKLEAPLPPVSSTQRSKPATEGPAWRLQR